LRISRPKQLRSIDHPRFVLRRKKDMLRGFTKYGFYLAHEYLERMRLDTDFSDVIFIGDKIGTIRD